jgi:hypothetical protein
MKQLLKYDRSLQIFIFIHDQSKDVSRLQVLGPALVLRLVSLRICGRFHEPEPKQRDPPEPWAWVTNAQISLGATE